jgi:hypothetical protein
MKMADLHAAVARRVTMMTMRMLMIMTIPMRPSYMTIHLIHFMHALASDVIPNNHEIACLHTWE